MRLRTVWLGLLPFLFACSNPWYLPADFRTMELTYEEWGATDDTLRGGLSIDLTALTITGNAANATNTIACYGSRSLTDAEAAELTARAAATVIYRNGRYVTDEANPPLQTLSSDDDRFDVLPGRVNEFFLHTGRCALMAYLNEIFPAADRDLCPASLERMFNCEDQGESP